MRGRSSARVVPRPTRAACPPERGAQSSPTSTDAAAKAPLWTPPGPSPTMKTRPTPTTQRLPVNGTTRVSASPRRPSSGGTRRIPARSPPWRSTVELSAGFFSSIVDRPVPVDLRAVKALRSPMALDISTWLTYRMSYLRQPTRIPGEALQFQFGAHYALGRDFKEAFLRHARTVLTLYPAPRLESHPNGLLLKPSHPHVSRTTSDRPPSTPSELVGHGG